MAGTNRLRPTGGWWCECGAGTAVGCFVHSSHDTAAEAAVLAVASGSVPRLLVPPGDGPGGTSPRREVEQWRAAGKGGTAR